MNELPLQPFDRLCKNNGVKRVSRSALEKIREVTELWCSELIKQADELCKHSNRVTVKAIDVELAAKHVQLKRSE